MKIYLYKSTDPIEILKELDMLELEEYSAFLASLPMTKRGNPAFKTTGDLAIVFARKIDATAFRLKFGL